MESACVHAKSLQSCLTLCDPMNCSPPGSSIHGILQARILEWVAMPSSRGSSHPGIKSRSPTLHLYHLSHQGSPMWNLEHGIMILFTKQKQRHRRREQMCGHQGGRGMWDELGDWDWHTYTIGTMYKIDNQQEPTLQHIKLYSVLCGDLNSKET